MGTVRAVRDGPGRSGSNPIRRSSKNYYLGSYVGLGRRPGNPERPIKAPKQLKQHETTRNNWQTRTNVLNPPFWRTLALDPGSALVIRKPSSNKVIWEFEQREQGAQVQEQGSQEQGSQEQGLEEAECLGAECSGWVALEQGA